MTPTRLRIDTSVSRITGQSSTYVRSREAIASASSQVQSAKSHGRLRSASSASASSSTSDPSRALSKAAASVVHHVSYSVSADPHVSDPSNWSPTYSSSGESDPGSPGYVLAMHDFAPQHQNVTCLGFRAGEVIHVLNRDPSGWWDGELDGRRGWFPSNYVTSEVGLLTNEELPKAVSTRSSLFSHTGIISAVMRLPPLFTFYRGNVPNASFTSGKIRKFYSRWLSAPAGETSLFSSNLPGYRPHPSCADTDETFFIAPSQWASSLRLLRLDHLVDQLFVPPVQQFQPLRSPTNGFRKLTLGRVLSSHYDPSPPRHFPIAERSSLKSRCTFSTFNRLHHLLRPQYSGRNRLSGPQCRHLEATRRSRAGTKTDIVRSGLVSFAS